MNAAERKIGDFLDSVGIKYVYENPQLIEQDYHGKKFLRIFYPDFFLTEYGILLEFWGMHKNKEYAKGMEKKKQDYYYNWLFVVNVYNLEGNWQQYILDKIKTVSEHRMKVHKISQEKWNKLSQKKDVKQEPKKVKSKEESPKAAPRQRSRDRSRSRPRPQKPMQKASRPSTKNTPKPVARPAPKPTAKPEEKKGLLKRLFKKDG
ncbi:MAG: hypothetical protein ACE5DM_02445 [Candidatus Nanoarchaeia archaeon]